MSGVRVLPGPCRAEFRRNLQSETTVTRDRPWFGWLGSGLERYQAKVGGREEPAPVALRVTTVFRPEDDTWKVVQRHVDPINTEQPAESVLQT